MVAFDLTYLIKYLLSLNKVHYFSWHAFKICEPPSHAFWAWSPRQYGGQSSCFEWLKSEGSQSWNFCEESISQRLKKSKKFAFSNSPFTRQQNISLNGTKSKMFDRVSRKCFINNLHVYERLVSAMQIWHITPEPHSHILMTGGPSDFFGSEILAQGDFFWV